MASKAEELILTLAGLITEAESLEPLLADRLRQISKWLSKYSPGQITSKKFVLAVLEEICSSSEQWLILSTGNAREKSSFLSSMELADMYWSTCLFSSWFQLIDLKQAKWQRALGTNQFLPTDSKTLAKVGQAIKISGGTFVAPLIADLAMATDLIAKGYSLPTSVCSTHHSKRQLPPQQVWRLGIGIEILGDREGATDQLQPSKRL